MHPEICSIGPVTIYSYGLMLVIAFFAAVTLACAQAKKEGINPDFVFNFSFVVFIFGIIGARVFYISYNLGYYIGNPKEIIMFSRGGMSWFGGFFLGLAAGLAYLKIKKEGIYKILDLIAPFVALAQSLGRVGCFLNGCCFGRESAYGIYFPVHAKALIPTQIYSSLLLLVIFVFLRSIQSRPHRQGQVFYAYVFLYSLKRFIIELFRADSKAVIFNLTLFQVICVFLFFFSAFKLASFLRREIK